MRLSAAGARNFAQRYELDAKVDKEPGKALSSNDYTAPEKAKLAGIEAGANAYVHPVGDGNLHLPATGTGNNGKVLTAGATAGSATWQPLPTSPVVSVAGKVGAVALTKTDVGLSSVDNTSDAAKPISTAMQAALDSKANVNASTTGNAATATKLATARTINGVAFDGTQNITIATGAALASSMTAQYDAQARVSSVTEDGVQTTITYDSNGRVATTSYPRAGKTRTETYSYNGAGQLTGMIATEA